MNAITVDAMHVEPHSTGWSLGEIAFDHACRRIWQVDARRGENWIIAREYNQTAAWREAWREARTSPDAALDTHSSRP